MSRTALATDLSDLADGPGAVVPGPGGFRLDVLDPELHPATMSTASKSAAIPKHDVLVEPTVVPVSSTLPSATSRRRVRPRTNSIDQPRRSGATVAPR